MAKLAAKKGSVTAQKIDEARMKSNVSPPSPSFRPARAMGAEGADTPPMAWCRTPARFLDPRRVRLIRFCVRLVCRFSRQRVRLLRRRSRLLFSLVRQFGRLVGRISRHRLGFERLQSRERDGRERCRGSDRDGQAGGGQGQGRVVRSESALYTLPPRCTAPNGRNTAPFLALRVESRCSRRTLLVHIYEARLSVGKRERASCNPITIWFVLDASHSPPAIPASLACLETPVRLYRAYIPIAWSMASYGARYAAGPVVSSL